MIWLSYFSIFISHLSFPLHSKVLATLNYCSPLQRACQLIVDPWSLNILYPLPKMFCVPFLSLLASLPTD